MKNNLDFYRHKVQSHDHWKFKALRFFYQKEFGTDGWAGEGKFWALNNKIAESNYCMLNITRDKDNVTRDISEIPDEEQKITIATDLGFTLEEFDRFLDILIDRCKLLKVKEYHLISEDTQDVLAELQEKRLLARERQKKRRQTLEKERRNTSSHTTSEMSRVTGDENTRDRHTKYSIYNSNGSIDKSILPAEGDQQEGKTGSKKKTAKKKTAPPPATSPGPKMAQEAKGSPLPASPSQRRLELAKASKPLLKAIYEAWYKSYEEKPYHWSYGKCDKALKTVTDYFLTIAAEEYKGMKPTDDQVVSRVKILFSNMLESWDKLSGDKFLSRTDIVNIASNLNNITSTINSTINGKAKTNQPAPRGSGPVNRKSEGAYELLEQLKGDLGGNLSVGGRAKDPETEI